MYFTGGPGWAEGEQYAASLEHQERDSGAPAEPLQPGVSEETARSGRGE